MIILYRPEESWQHQNDTSFDSESHCQPKARKQRLVLHLIITSHDHVQDHDFVIVHRGVVRSSFLAAEKR